MEIEFRDLKKQYQLNKDKIDQAVLRVLEEGQFISGPDVARFERRMADFVGVKHCLSCANGTDALSLVLMAWNIGPGDAVFVPDFTFFASAEVVAYAGATPVFVDVERETFNMDPKSLEDAILAVRAQGRLLPKVIISVDLFGLPANYASLEALAKKYDLLLLEDAAQGFGGRLGDRQACSFGHASTTSFFPAKPLGCYGDGGAIFTNDDALATLISSLKVHGKGQDKYDNVRIGVNSRLDTLQAAILDVKLQAFIDYELVAVNQIYHWYTEALHGCVETPFIPESFFSSFAQYTIKLRDEEERSSLMEFLAEHRIPTMVYYSKAMHEQTAFHALEPYVPLNTAKELTSRSLSLPMHPYLTETEVETISGLLKSFLAAHRQ